LQSEKEKEREGFSWLNERECASEVNGGRDNVRQFEIANERVLSILASSMQCEAYNYCSCFLIIAVAEMNGCDGHTLSHRNTEKTKFIFYNIICCCTI